MSDAEVVRPALQVVRGDPTPEEVAVLTALVAAVAAAAPESRPRVRRGGWNDPARSHRRELLPGPNGWRTAGR
jgi:hypothetical protein